MEKFQENFFQSGDLQSCIDVGQIMENIQREQFIVNFIFESFIKTWKQFQRQQKSAEQTEGITTSLLNWKNTNDSEMKTLENQMELLRKRKEQIKQNSTEMSALANQLRQRLELIRGSKEQSELGREGEFLIIELPACL